MTTNANGPGERTGADGDEQRDGGNVAFRIRHRPRAYVEPLAPFWPHDPWWYRYLCPACQNTHLEHENTREAIRGGHVTPCGAVVYRLIGPTVFGVEVTASTGGGE